MGETIFNEGNFQKAPTDLKKRVGEAGCSFSILTFPFKIQERMEANRC